MPYQGDMLVPWRVTFLSRRISRVSVDICSLCWCQSYKVHYEARTHIIHMFVSSSIHCPAVAWLAIFIYAPIATDVILPTIAMPLTHQSHGQHLVTKRTCHHVNPTSFHKYQIVSFKT